MPEALVALGTISRAMQEYSVRTSRFIKAQSIELFAMLQLLNEAIVDSNPARPALTGSVGEILWRAQKANTLEEIRKQRILLTECLRGFKNGESTSSVVSVAKESEKIARNGNLRAATETVETEDALTGLASRPTCELALHEASVKGEHCWAAIFVVDRIQSINTRFGHSIGDRVIVHFLQQLAQSLTPTDQIFRWSGPSFLALMRRSEKTTDVNQEIERKMFRRLEEVFSLGPREIVIPIGSHWTSFSVLGTSVEHLIPKIDRFIEQHLK